MSEADPREKFTDAMLVARYLEIRDFINDEDTKQDEYLKPHRDNLLMIGGELHRRLLERSGEDGKGKTSGTAGGGTFFLKKVNSVKVADRESYFDWIYENWQWARQKLLTAHVAKDGVDEYMAMEDNKAGSPPPGITVETIRQLQVRKV